MALNRGFADSWPEPEPARPLPETEGEPPDRTPPTAVGYSGDDEPEPRFIRLVRPNTSIGFTAVIHELSTVVWPSRHDIIYLTLFILAITLILGAVLGVVDMAFGWLIEQILL